MAIQVVPRLKVARHLLAKRRQRRSRMPVLVEWDALLSGAIKMAASLRSNATGPLGNVGAWTAWAMKFPTPAMGLPQGVKPIARCLRTPVPRTALS